MIAALALLLQIGAAAPDSGTPAVVRRAFPTPGAEVSFRALIVPDTVYVGQQATYQLGVFVDERVRDRLRRMEAMAPEMRGMLAYDPDPQRGSFSIRAAGRRYEAHAYQRAVFPLTAGRHVIPSARLVYAVPLSFSFFSREESFELRSDSATVVAVEPPLAGRPHDYAGAVGSMRIETRLDSTARVGVPLQLVVRIIGSGNVKLFPRPAIQVPWASTVTAGERVRLDPGLLVIRGAKDFSWVLTPQRSGEVVLPPVRYAFFDPELGRYDVAQSLPETLHVAPGALAAVDAGAQSATPRYALRTTYRGELSLPVYRRTPFWWSLAVVPLPALVIVVARRPRRARTRRPAAVRLRALARADASRVETRELRQIYLRAVADRLRASPTAIAEPSAFERAARRAGVSSETARQGAALLGELDGAAFGPVAHPIGDGARRAHTLYRAVDREARTFEPLPRSAAPLIVALLAAGAVPALYAAIPPEHQARFDRGVRAYHRAEFRESMREFAAVAVAAPRAADAWANLGTAAFAAGDTARAALGWQKALRLEPLAGDARERLAVLSAGPSSPGAVPPVPPSPVALAAAALWVLAWTLVAVNLHRGRPLKPVMLGAGGGALALAFAALAIDDRLAGRDLAVVERGAPLRVLPALAAEPEGAVRTGEIARVLERRAEWARITPGPAQEGWVESALLIPLARD